MNSGPRRILFVFGLVAVCYFAIRFEWKPVLVEYLTEKTYPKASRENHSTAKKRFENIKKTKSSIADYNSILLADSIISIIKTYYVDIERVSDKNILDAILYSLEKKLKMKVDRYNNLIKIYSNGKDISLYVEDVITHELLLRYILLVGNFIENNREFIEETKKSNQRSEKTFGLSILLNSLVSTLDAHSGLLSAEAYGELKQGTEGAFGGLGVLVGMRDQLLTVIKPLPKSPAMRQGIGVRDRILSINGIDTYGSSLADLVEYMRGDPGTKVSLSLLKEGAMSAQRIELQREVIEVESVSSKIVNHQFGKVLSLKIDSFTSKTSDELKVVLDSYTMNNSNEDLGGIILDLRSNPGGLLDQAIKVADIFLSHGVIVSTKGRTTEVELASNSSKDQLRCPLVIIINEESASASEIVAGALQDHDRSIVVGQPSFGKGSVQTIFELPREKALKLTIARYLTPSGLSIQNIGIFPDIWLQPVYISKSNKNLLGSFRYKNEGFLSNNLNNHTSRRNNDYYTSTFKGYYLRKPVDEFDFDLDADRETELANSILEQVNLHGDPVLLKSNMRASHWLSLAGSSINKVLSRLGNDVEEYLESQFNIAWTKDLYDGDISKLSLYLTPEKKIHRVFPGQRVYIPYLLKNDSVKELHHLSIFVRNDDPDFETNEILLGSINGESQLKGSTYIEVPPYWKPGYLSLEIGIALGGRADTSKSQILELEVLKRENPVINVEFDLVQEFGGSTNGELEANERAILAVHLKNIGKVRARDLDISIVNLAGRQLVVPRNHEIVSSISPNQDKVVFFEILGSHSIVSKKIDLGFLIKSKDLNSPVKKKVEISAIPSSNQVERAMRK